jgi:two-component system sensor histidine kinase BaeS
MSLRRRVLAYMALAAILSCALTVGVAAVLVRNRVAAQRMSTLEAQADAVAAVGGAPNALQPGDHVYRVGTPRPRLLAVGRRAAVLAAIPSEGNAEGTVNVDGRSLLYAARMTPSGRVVLVRPAALAFAEWRPFLGSLLLAGIGGAVLAALLAFLLARRLTRPVSELAGATRRLAAGEQGVSVPVRGEDELAQLGSAFNEMSSELEQARESQRHFLESVSHELKTPLTSIRGYAEALEEGAVTPAEGGRVISSEADRLQRLVADLLDLARLGRAGFSVAQDPVDLAAVADHAVSRHLPSAREMAVQLRDVTDAADGAWALGDEGRVLQVTSNLIENALRLSPAGGTVAVCADSGQITVRDSGPGLAPEDLPHAFERFYLYDRYRSERPVGSGLGLAIVQELTRAMGGTVQVANRDGGGAEFTVHLPTRQDRTGVDGAG